MKILVSDMVGFIGFHTTEKLLSENQQDIELIGIDNINDYCPMTLKYAGLIQLGISQDYIRYNRKIQSEKYPSFSFVRLYLTDEIHLMNLLREYLFDYIIHLVAQTSVRFSIHYSDAYIQSCIVGFNHILKACRTFPVWHLVYASSSSAYGLNKNNPLM